MRLKYLTKYQVCTKGRKSGGAGSNAARRRCPAGSSDLPKSGGAAVSPASPLGASLTTIQKYNRGYVTPG